jgi:hypothetical protein
MRMYSKYDNASSCSVRCSSSSNADINTYTQIQKPTHRQTHIEIHTKAYAYQVRLRVQLLSHSLFIAHTHIDKNTHTYQVRQRVQLLGQLLLIVQMITHTYTHIHKDTHIPSTATRPAAQSFTLHCTHTHT